MRAHWVVCALVGALLTGALGGCSTSADEPAAGPPPGPPEPEWSPTGVADTSLPRRPRDLRLDGIDPCTLMPAKLRAQLRVNTDMNRAPVQDGLRGPICEWLNAPLSPPYRLSVRLVQNRSIRPYLYDQDARISGVAGFGAVDLPGPLLPRDQGCVVRVDTGPEQSLWVGYMSEVPVDGQSYTRMCTNAHSAAEHVMSVLLAGQ